MRSRRWQKTKEFEVVVVVDTYWHYTDHEFGVWEMRLQSSVVDPQGYRRSNTPTTPKSRATPWPPWRPRAEQPWPPRRPRAERAALTTALNSPFSFPFLLMRVWVRNLSFTGLSKLSSIHGSLAQPFKHRESNWMHGHRERVTFVNSRKWVQELSRNRDRSIERSSKC